MARFLDVHLSVSKLPFLVRGDEFESGHLWFVVLLLAFSLVVAVAVAVVPGQARGRWLAAVVAAVDHKPALLLVPAVPLAAISAGLGLEEEYGAWHRLGYLVFFCCGLLLASDPRLRAAVRRVARPAAWLSVALFVGTGPAFAVSEDPFTSMEPLAVVGRTLFGATGWCSVVAILGLLDRPRTRRSGEPDPVRGSTRARLSAYLGEAVLPLYVLHQPIVVAVAYVVVGWELPAVIKYVVIVAASLALTVGAYDVLVRRTAVTRFLFGMRPEETGTSLARA